MGDYRIVIDAIGGHGCSREIKDGFQVYGCRRMSCPDCQAREFVAQLKWSGENVVAARFEHWPAQQLKQDGTLGDRGSPPGPIEDLLTGIRKGSF